MRRNEFVIVRHPEKYRRVMHRLQDGETIGAVSDAARRHFDIPYEVVMVDPWSGEPLARDKRCLPGEYNLEYA